MTAPLPGHGSPAAHEAARRERLADLAASTAKAAALSAIDATATTAGKRWRTGWIALLTSSVARVILVMLASLLSWSLLPAALGWQPTVVMSGSMAPRLSPGDVVIARPVPAAQLQLGEVLLVSDPDHAHRLRLHRLVAVRPDGTLTLRGDANRADDSSPVDRSAVHGVGALRVPYLGLPVLWIRDRNYRDLTFGLLTLVVVVSFAGLYRGEQNDPAPPPTSGTPSGSTPRGRIGLRRWRAVGALLIIGAVSASGLTDPSSAQATTRFSRTSANPSSTLSAVPYFTCQAAVLAANPFLYLKLGEGSGSTAADSSGNANNGTYQGGWSGGQAGSCSRDGSTAVTLNGSTGYVSTAIKVSNPTIFSLETWFKTTTSRGGLLIGLAASTTGASGSADRQLYLSNAGQVVFGVNAGTFKTISSNAGFNDGNWHLADATLSAGGLALYLDGQLVASDASTTSGLNYKGYWRIGYDSLAGRPSAPSSNFFSGTLDQVSIYTAALTPAQISGHHTAA